MQLTSGNKLSWLVTVWNALPKELDVSDDEWNDICTAMSWIAEEFGLDDCDILDACE
jgi:hypothetical protein